MTRAFVAAIVILALAPSTSPHAQDRPGPAGASSRTGPTGLIVGRVIDASSGRGVPGAVVMISGGPAGGFDMFSDGLSSRSGSAAGAGPQQVRTTQDGHFVFRGLRPGRYSLTAQKAGYVDGAYGRRIPNGADRSLALAEGERIGTIDIPVWRHAAIVGRVIDEAGEPVVGILVRAMRRAALAGRRQFVPAGIERTDDRGIYRISRLAPGDYFVVVPAAEVAVPLDMLQELRDTMATQSAVRSATGRAILEAGSSTALPG